MNNRHTKTAMGNVVVAGLLVTAFSFPCVGQGVPIGYVEGLVVDVEGFTPLPGVEVWLEYTDFRTVTDATGTFALAGIPMGTYRIIVRRIGFERVSAENYEVVADSVQRIDFALTASAVALEDIEVTAPDVPSSEITRSSSVLHDEDLPKQGDILAALQGRIPGLRVTGRYDDMRVRLRGGSAEPIFVINGTPVTPPLRFYIGSSEVECVEIRRGQQAVLEYRSSAKTDVYNGVILIWTKDSGRRMTGGCSEGR